VYVYADFIYDCINYFSCLRKQIYLIRIKFRFSRGSRTQTKWPKDKLTATGLDANFWPTPDAARDRFVLVCGLIARERVSINKAVVDLSPIEKDHMFIVLEEKLDYPANLEEFVRKKAVKAAISQIGTLQRWFKAR
jgi:hypothetical protein